MKTLAVCAMMPSPPKSIGSSRDRIVDTESVCLVLRRHRHFLEESSPGFFLLALAPVHLTFIAVRFSLDVECELYRDEWIPDAPTRILSQYFSPSKSGICTVTQRKLIGG